MESKKTIAITKDNFDEVAKMYESISEKYFYICITDTDKNIEYTSYHY